MRIQLQYSRKRASRLPAFSLVEVIGVIAVIAGLATFLVPAGIRHIDRIVAEKETTELRSLDDSLQSAILRQHKIPTVTNWPSLIATEAGRNLQSVRFNIRNKQRAFVADQGGWLGGTRLPYTNAPYGTTNYPSTARVMIISTLGAALPATIESGMTAIEFERLWSSADGSIPGSTSTIWNGWQGDPDDIKVRRINLGSLFHRLVLSTYTAATNGQFSIDGTALQPATKGAGYSAYYLKGTLANLLTGSPDNKTNHVFILNEDVSFVYEYGIWRNSIVGGEVYGLGDISGIVAAFLAATPNSNAAMTNENNQQIAVVDSFIKYMSNYATWASLGFPSSMRKPFMENLQLNMMSNVYGLFLEQGQYHNYPTNPSACVIP